MTFAILAGSANADEDFENKVIEAILNNPEVVLIAIEKINEQRALEERVAQRMKITENAISLFGDDDDLRVAEFFDYRCGYCAQSAAGIKELPNNTQNAVRLIELPILGQASRELAKVSLAVRNLAGQEAYRAFHYAIFEAAGRVGGYEAAIRLAASMGHNADAIRAEAGSDSVAAELLANRHLAEALGIDGTPTFVSRDQVHGGMLTTDDIKSIIDANEDES